MSDKELHSEVEISHFPEMYKDINIKLEYYLTKKAVEEDEKQGKLNIYGVEVIKKEYLKESIINTENQTVYNLLSDKTKTIQLLNQLSQNMVTPISLYEVLDDLIGISY